MSLIVGTQIGSYEILSAVGAGGMGEVYRCRDARLDRDVAIKVLPDAMTRDPERVARFEREAKLLASLSHTNIAAVHGFDESDGVRFLVLEFVEGETLAAVLKSGGLRVDDALEICKQVAEALEAAHERGVIHRDLKPGNVMVRPDRTVKVLDFGLAKALTDEAGDSGTATSPTITADYTRPGVVLGTAAYMSPEQARGRPLDKRTDIWSFGVILFECLSGTRLFGGDNATDSMGAILHKEPEWALLPPETPPTVQLLLRRCLARDRKQRLHDIADARIEIETAIDDPTSSSLALAAFPSTDKFGRGTKSARAVLQWVGIAALIAVAATAAWFGKPAAPSLGRIKTQILPPPDSRVLFAGDVAGPVAVSPDGKAVAFVAEEPGRPRQLYVRRLDEFSAEPLRGTQGAMFPFWSPDSRSLGFFEPGRLKRIDLNTKATMVICDAANGRGGTWLKNDVILFSPNFQEPLYRVDAGGGEPEQVTEIDQSKHTSHRWPARVGDGEHFLFSAINHAPALADQAAIYLGSLDGSEPRQVVRNLLSGEYAHGHLLFVRDRVLMAATLDVETGTLSGDAIALADGVFTDLSTWRAGFSASETSVLAFHPVPHTKGSSQDEMGDSYGLGTEANVAVRVTREGRPTNQIAEGIPQRDFRLSPDGNRLAIGIFGRGDLEFGTDLWIYDVSDGPPEDVSPPPQRVTSMPSMELTPVWSPDGEELVFSSILTGNLTSTIYRKRIGGGMAEPLYEEKREGWQAWPEDWSRDGKYLAFSAGDYTSAKHGDLWILPMDGGDPYPFIQTDDVESNGRFSPNGKWFAYQSAPSDSPIALSDIYVVPFNPLTDRKSGSEPQALNPDQRWQVSVGGGVLPVWRADGKELFYISQSEGMVAVTVDTDEDVFRIGASTALFPTTFESGDVFDVLPDGQSFILSETTVNVDTPISVIVNWDEELEH